jgi:DNA-binding transcriptional LysR family regulator
LRLPTYGGLLAWEFKNGGKITNVHVEGRLLFNRSDLMADAAVAGHGLAWLPEDMVQEHLAAGRLVTVLDDWGITFPGYHLYYASRRSSLALSLVIDALRIPKSR